MDHAQTTQSFLFPFVFWNSLRKKISGIFGFSGRLESADRAVSVCDITHITHNPVCCVKLISHMENEDD